MIFIEEPGCYAHLDEQANSSSMSVIWNLSFDLSTIGCERTQKNSTDIQNIGKNGVGEGHNEM